MKAKKDTKRERARVGVVWVCASPPLACVCVCVWVVSVLGAVDISIDLLRAVRATRRLGGDLRRAFDLRSPGPTSSAQFQALAHVDS